LIPQHDSAPVVLAVDFDQTKARQQNLRVRQKDIRDALAALAGQPEDEAAVASLVIGIQPGGKVRSTIIGVEPEQVQALLQALGKVTAQLLDYAAMNAPYVARPVSLVR
jgi:hypothetical protein